LVDQGVVEQIFAALNLERTIDDADHATVFFKHLRFG